MYFDTHTHVNFDAFKQDQEDVVKRALENNTWMVNVGTQIDTSKSAVELAQKYEQGVYAAIGLHPVHTYQQMLDEEESRFKTREESFDESIYTPLLDSNRVVAVGECGLDYFRIPVTSNKESATAFGGVPPSFNKLNSRGGIISKQKTEFIKQLHFAKKNNLPVIVHCRDAYDDVLEILKAEYEGAPGIIHSFTDTWDTAKKFVDFGFFVALNGILTFDKTGRLALVAKNTPLNQLLIETDAPYLTPPPHRGKRNEPSFVKFVAEKIAVTRGISFEEVSEATFNNALKVFQIKKTG